ncbi:EPT/RTPC-like protein [Aaosphaeria arxii CBS 175.79]|uniref:EPT/RTPC-like protein n=1 Tax=Aaosphaeria arxii CBS 175.79 TaxID=1450172 RepID=A0A6A5Y3F7_9PLEO|nr:EPT/RTPC-like protein [Aaosphaeria arxii CBS 175.79]KAF2019796.1 EPT/RTPC-like protein [Aaosphaeria arxii CBS 175.79]
MAPPNTTQPIHLPGTTLEGGGQLLRNALALSSLLRTPIHVTSIRGNRSGGGGLKAQHLVSLQFLAAASGAGVKGIGLGSKEVVFSPGERERHGFGGSVEAKGDSRKRRRKIEIKQATPGSVSLVFQAVLPFLMFGGCCVAADGKESGEKEDDGEGEIEEEFELLITGGTNVSNSPSFDYTAQVLIPMLKMIGIPDIEVMCSRGWSQGRTSLGWVRYRFGTLRDKLPAFRLVDRGSLVKVNFTILAPGGSERDFRDEVEVAWERFSRTAWPDVGPENEEPEMEVSFEDSRDAKRYYLLVVATTSTGMKLGRDWLYDRGVRAGKTDGIAREMLRKVLLDMKAELDHEGCVDEWMRDQLIVFQGLAEGKSEVNGGRRRMKNGEEGQLVEPSLHAKTAQWVAAELLNVSFDDEGGCEGVGYAPGHHNGNAQSKEHSGDGLVESMEKLDIKANTP